MFLGKSNNILSK